MLRMPSTPESSDALCLGGAGDHVKRSVLPSAMVLKLEEVGTSIAAAMHPTSYDIVVPSYPHDELHVVSQLRRLSESTRICIA